MSNYSFLPNTSWDAGYCCVQTSWPNTSCIAFLFSDSPGTPCKGHKCLPSSASEEPWESLAANASLVPLLSVFQDLDYWHLFICLTKIFKFCLFSLGFFETLAMNSFHLPADLSAITLCSRSYRRFCFHEKVVSLFRDISSPSSLGMSNFGSVQIDKVQVLVEPK